MTTDKFEIVIGSCYYIVKEDTLSPYLKCDLELRLLTSIYIVFPVRVSRPYWSMCLNLLCQTRYLALVRCSSDVNALEAWTTKKLTKLFYGHHEVWNITTDRFVCCTPLTAFSRTLLILHRSRISSLLGCLRAERLQVLCGCFQFSDWFLYADQPLHWPTWTGRLSCRLLLMRALTCICPSFRQWFSQIIWMTDLYSANVLGVSQKLPQEQAR